MFSTGEKPGKGVYVCKECRIVVALLDDEDALPYCPCCESRIYIAKSNLKQVIDCQEE
jgi:DNA-directed RNA polymerase subunit RPC12/RpoP